MVPCSISSNKKLRRQSVSVTWVSNAIALHAEPQYNATTPGGQPQSGVALAWTPWGGDSYQVWRTENGGTSVMIGTAITEGAGGYPAQTIDLTATDAATYTIKALVDGQVAVVSNSPTVTLPGQFPA